LKILFVTNSSDSFTTFDTTNLRFFRIINVVVLTVQEWWKRGGRGAYDPPDFGRIEGRGITTCPVRFSDLAPSLQYIRIDR
jgi:hypothetical protein